MFVQVNSYMAEGSLEVKLQTIWTDGKAEVWRVKEKKWEDQKRERERRKKMQVHEKGRKVAIHCVFAMICGSGGSKSRLAKAAGAEPSGQMREEKLHTVVARSTFPSQNVQGTPAYPSTGPLLEVQMSKKCTRVWREAHFQVKMHKAHHSRTTLGSSDVEKVHTTVARRTN